MAGDIVPKSNSKGKGERLTMLDLRHKKFPNTEETSSRRDLIPVGPANGC